MKESTRDLLGKIAAYVAIGVCAVELVGGLVCLAVDFYWRWKLGVTLR